MPIVHLTNQKSFEASPDVSILDAAKQAGLVLEHSCRSGRCRSCRTQVLAGTVIALKPDLSLSPEERQAGWVLTCANAAAEDVRIDAEDLGLPADIVLKTLPCRIDTIEHLAPDVMGVVLRLPPNTQWRYLPGQYIDVIWRDVRRSYSIANAPRADSKIELHIRKVDGGAMSAYWFDQARPNDLLRFKGPRGTFFLREVAGLDLVFLATGTGVAPIKAMLTDLTLRPAEAQPRSVQLFWGGRYRPDLYWQPSFPTLNLSFTPLLSRADGQWTGAQGYVQHALIQSHPEWARTTVYACGSASMIDRARAVLAEAGLPTAHFLSDAFVSSN
jgi:CDP-4-dehydro-6-deoxyglucose reductase, E3